jgi:hypothetical protein
MDFDARLYLHRIAIALLLGALIAVSSAYIKQGKQLTLLRNHHNIEHVEWNQERERLEQEAGNRIGLLPAPPPLPPAAPDTFSGISVIPELQNH